MDVKILSMSKANSYCTEKKASIIRIGDSDSDLPDLKQVYEHKCILKFYDIEPKPSLPSNWNWFNKSDGEKVLHFFNSIDNSEELIIHCHAGISRSPAIGLAYAWFKKDEELEKLIMNGPYAPNAQVLKVMAKLLGVYKDKKPFIYSCSRL